mmetsp:Transcript_5777/g.9900  ORF Transcript_5777/g.9900 Transcript_5777/m.9900 type:complete len:256 (-) Transcript_5777:30-797(-)
MAESSNEFGNLVFPASSYTVKRRNQLNDTYRQIDTNPDEPPTMSEAMGSPGAASGQGTLGGKWTNRKLDSTFMSPAGMRIPKDFKRTLGDKIPELIEKMRGEGRSEKEIREAVQAKKSKSVEKYGNKSKVGLVLDMHNHKLLNNSKILNNDSYLRKLKIRNVSDFNRAHLQQSDFKKFGSQMVNTSTSAMFKLASSGVDSECPTWSTTNQEFFQPKEIKDLDVYRKNFKKKTPFTQWSNAYFSNGVFFNPPVQGI